MHAPAIIFLHGGPGYNCAGFEATAAAPLASKGFFVIVYDRRGEGRSTDNNAKYTFEQTFDDLSHLCDSFSVKSATLIGHSFGGIVAVLYVQRNRQRVRSVLLVSAPVSLQESFKNIIERSKIIYREKNDTSNLHYIAMLEQMDTSSLEYASYSFAHAMQNGFYSPKNPTNAAKERYHNLRKDSLAKFASQMSYQAPQGFYRNEHYTSIDLTNNIKAVLRSGIPIYRIYGKEDGLYSLAQVARLNNMLGKNNLLYLDDCSHNVFIDQQEVFLKTVESTQTGLH